MYKIDPRECECFPYYGIAPHEHRGFNPNEPLTIFGSTVLKPKESWPPEFVEDEQEGWDGCGMYYCPHNDCPKVKTCPNRLENNPDDFKRKQKQIEALKAN
jgi:hypothetical protein